MKKELKDLQISYEDKIESFLLSINGFKDEYVDVEFKLDFNLQEYFFIKIGNYTNILLECDKNPYLRLTNNTFDNYDELKEISKILNILSKNKSILNKLLNMVKDFYNESAKFLDK